MLFLAGVAAAVWLGVAGLMGGMLFLLTAGFPSTPPKEDVMKMYLFCALWPVAIPYLYVRHKITGR